MQKVVFISGERKYVSIHIRPRTSSESFSIARAEWALYKNGVEIKSDDAEIDEHTIRCLVQPPEGAFNSYDLVVTYQVANQLLKAAFELEVTHGDKV